MSSDIPMFTAAQRGILLKAHDKLISTIRFTKGGLAALNANSKDVDRVALDAEKLKKFLDDAHDRDRFEFDRELIAIAAQALSIYVAKLAELRKTVAASGVATDDVDEIVVAATNLGRDLKPELFPVQEKTGDLFEGEK